MHDPLRGFGEHPRPMDQVHRQLQVYANRWPRWWESLETLGGMLALRGTTITLTLTTATFGKLGKWATCNGTVPRPYA